ncbi:MAG: nucleoside monophosphate kinase [Candidatus Nanoarchaeia archaeon]|nr:nucleoside monophosphate kinase [Candidatus Nanoarchaeia archaeon]
MKLSIIGPAGSGKGVQAELLSKKYKLKIIAAGELLRHEEKKKTKIGKIISKFVDKGNLVPNKIIENLIKKRLPKNNFLIDGFPRDLPEAKWLEKLSPLDLVIHLDTRKQVVLKRLSNRRVCPRCHEIYHLINKKPKKAGICDKCKSKLIQRIDDKPKFIKKRLEVYKKETIPVVRFFEKKQKLVHVDGNKSVKNVFNQINKILKNEQ